jgi:hypothetical protein
MVATTKTKPKSKKGTTNAPAREHGIGVLKEKYKGAQEALDKFDRKSEVLQQEGRIEQAQQSFIEIVEALHVIEEQGLYRYLADSMTEYARLRWGWGSATVTRHKNAYLVLQAVEKFDVRPLNEGHAQLLKRRVPQKAIICALPEFDAGDQLGADPVHASPVVTRRSFAERNFHREQPREFQ